MKEAMKEMKKNMKEMEKKEKEKEEKEEEMKLPPSPADYPTWMKRRRRRQTSLLPLA